VDTHEVNNAARRRRPPPWAWPALVVLAVACFLAARNDRRGAALADVAGWSLEDVLGRLREREVAFEVMSDPPPRPGRSDPGTCGAWLTRGRRGREELARLTRFDEPEAWRGVVRVAWRASWVGEPPEEQEPYAERLLVVGPFSLFGDPDMLREVERALAE
jgi:hypothetical protein